MEIGVCSQCHRRTYIQNKTRCLCSDCVYKNNHNGKSRIEIARERQMKKAVVATKKPIKGPRKRRTGELSMFKDIWLKRPHFCVNCGKFLGDEPCSWMFSHRTAKGVSESERLNPDNIDLLCFDCHFARDMQGIEMYERRKDLFK